MKRRRFVLGIGSTALGTGALVGSGAFSTVDAERTVSVETANDDEAYLVLESVDTDDRSSQREGVLEFRLPSFEEQDEDRFENPEGLGTDSVYRFGKETEGEPLFVAKNQGTSEIKLFGRQEDVSSGHPEVRMFESESGELLTDDHEQAKLGVGHEIELGLEIDTTDVEIRPDNPYELTLTVVAEATNT